MTSVLYAAHSTQVLPTKQSTLQQNAVHRHKAVVSPKAPGEPCMTKEEFTARWGVTMGNPSTEEDWFEHIDYPVKCFHASPRAAVGLITYAYHPRDGEAPRIILLVYDAETGEYSSELWGDFDDRYDYCGRAERIADLLGME